MLVGVLKGAILTILLERKVLNAQKCGGEFDDVRIHKLMFQVDQGENMDPLSLDQRQRRAYLLISRNFIDSLEKSFRLR